MLEILSYDFMQNALIAGILVSIASGIIGSLIVVNRMVFLAGGIAHTSYGGIGLAVYFGLPIFFGASIFAILAALIMAFLTLHRRDRIDTFIGLIWAVGMAIGIIFVDLTPGYNVDLMSYLFGSILAVSSEDIYYMAFLVFTTIFIVTFWYRDILAVSYDSEYAKLRGINVNFFYTLILVLSALTVVIAIKVVGLILVIALLTIPIYIAEKLSNSLYTMMFISGILSSLFTTIGLVVSYTFNLTSGASIIIVAAFCLGLFLAFSKKVLNMKVYFLLTLCVLFWSGNFIIGRYVHNDIEPLSLALFRWLGAAVIVFPLFIQNFLHIYKVFKANPLILSILSLLGISIFNTFLYIGLQDTTATNALLINSSIPVLILVFSFFILKISIDLKQFLGIVFSTCGVIFLIIQGDFSTLFSLELNQGDIWIVLSSITWALYSVLVRFKPKELSDMEFFTTIVYVGLFWLFLAYLFYGGNFSKDLVHVKDFWWVFVYIALFTSVLSFFFWHKGIHTIGANKTGQFTHLMPLFGSILAYIFLDEYLMPYHVIGAFLIALGIYLSLFGTKSSNN